MYDCIEKAKNEIIHYLHNNYEDIKFTVKFNGEFFVVSADRELPKAIKVNAECADVRDAVGNRMMLKLKDGWMKDAVTNIPQAVSKSEDLVFYSQIKRLERQLEYNLSGGGWGAGALRLAGMVLYMLHTKSPSIRLNIVKQCACEYNKLQREGKIPRELTAGYKNALCMLSG